jgi:hypothetical protein
MTRRSHEEMVAMARVAGVELDDRYVTLAADAMAVWWDEVVAVRELNLGGMADASPLEPRTAPLVHPAHPVPPTAGSRAHPPPVGRPTDLADCTVTELLSLFAARSASPTESTR